MIVKSWNKAVGMFKHASLKADNWLKSHVIPKLKLAKMVHLQQI